MGKRCFISLLFYCLLIPGLVQAQSGGVPSTLGWYEIPNTKLRSVCPPNGFGGSGYAFADNCWGVIEAWNSATMDTTRNRLIIWGGGHSDYSGNEIYSLDLNSLTIASLTNPGVPLATGCPESIVNGTQPNSRHTYDGIEYMPNVDRLWVFGGSLATCGFGNQGTWTFSFSTNQWEKKNPTGTLPRGDLGIVSAYDPNTGKVFVHDSLDLYTYDFNTNNYQKLTTNSTGVDYHMTAAIDPKRKKFIMIGGSTSNGGGVVVYDIGFGSSYTRQRPSTSGGASIINTASPGLTYDPLSDRMVSWNGGNTVYSLNLDNNTWTSASYSGGPTAVPAGTFGRWQYSPASNVFVTINDVDLNARVFRLNNSSPTTPPLPTVVLSANPASIVSGTSSSLTWSATNASSCTASGGWSGTKGVSGSQGTGSLTSNTTFTLTCTGAGGSASQSASVSVTAPLSPSGSIPAFPGAEGFGTETPGGRGGKVYVITTLNWTGPGSLGQALLATEPRIIVFRVSGVINVPNGVELTEANSYVTVAGQTSPGGITLTGSPGYFIGNYNTNFHDAVFRFIRFRGRGNYDNIQFNGAHHLVFDHVDFSGGEDESFDITHGHNVTVQWSTITNSDSSGQNYGSLIAYNPTANFSLHHNFYAHHVNRCAPHFHWGGGVPASGATIDFRNNVVYNCAFDAIMWTNDADSSDEGSRIKFNLIGNYFKAGPNTPLAAYDYRMPAGSQRYESNTIYQGGTLRNVGNLSSPVSVPSVTTQSTAQAFDLVLDRAGAFPRDPMNTRTVAEARNGTGSMGKINDAFLTSAPTPPVDTDLDGMPDTWESARGLNPSNPSDAALDRDGDGYTNIEEYINELAAALIPGSSVPPPLPSSFDFTVANGGNKSVTQGSSVPNTISTSLVSGTTQPVSFSATGLPTGATYNYSPSSCNPNCSTTFTIAAGTSTPTGTYPVTVSGSGGGLTKTTSFNLTVTSSTTPPPTSGILQVGPTRQYTAIASAVSAAQDGHTIEIDAGVYANQTITISKNNLTLRGVGGYAHLKWGTGNYLTNTANISNGKGILVIQGNNITIENLELSGAKVLYENGAGIRYEGGNLTIRKSYFHDNENGILGEGGPSNTLLIENSVFERNGYCLSSCAHNIYIGNMGKLTFRYNKSIDAHEGHPLKSRAQVNEIISNYLSTKNSDGSYEADFPNGGTVYFIGNIVEQGANTGNSTMLAYGEEGSSNPNPALYIVNNTFYNQRGSGTFLSVSGSPTLAVKNNIFAGGGSVGVNADASNKTLTASSFINVSSSDYHLAAGSPAIDAGVNPGTAGSYNLAPQSEYVEPDGRKVRVTSGSAIDVGAHEFGSSPSSAPAAPTGLSLK